MQQKARSMSLQLEHDWTFYFDEGPPRGISKKEYQSYIKPLGSFNSIQARICTSLAIWIKLQ